MLISFSNPPEAYYLPGEWAGQLVCALEPVQSEIVAGDIVLLLFFWFFFPNPENRKSFGSIVLGTQSLLAWRMKSGECD